MNIIICFLGTKGKVPAELGKCKHSFVPHEYRIKECSNTQCSNDITNLKYVFRCDMCRKLFCFDPKCVDRKLGLCLSCCAEEYSRYDTDISLDIFNISSSKNHFYLHESVLYIMVNGVDSVLFPNMTSLVRNVSNMIVNLVRKKPNSNDLRKIIRGYLGKYYGGSVVPQINEFDVSNAYDNVNLILTGFSRGSVQTFALAKHIEEYKIQNLNIYIFANQPVPGNGDYSASTSYSIASKYYDLSGISSIRNIFILIGIYTKKQSLIVDKYYKQLIPKVADSVVINSILVPLEGHHGSSEIIDTAYYSYLLELNKILDNQILRDNNIRLFKDSYLMRYMMDINAIKYRIKDVILNKSVSNYEESFYNFSDFYNVAEEIYKIEKRLVRNIESTKGRTFTTESHNSCISCKDNVSFMHRHHCRVCSRGHYCDRCCPKNKRHNIRICGECHTFIFNIAYSEYHGLEIIDGVIQSEEKSGMSFGIGKKSFVQKV